jgi:hypothetical protein
LSFCAQKRNEGRIARWRHEDEAGRLRSGWDIAGVPSAITAYTVRTRPAKVGDSLTTRRFNMGTRGFSAPEDNNVAVCLLPGTELSFAEEIRRVSLWPWSKRVINHRTAIFRRVNQDKPAAHHDALGCPDGQIVLLTFLKCGQQARCSGGSRRGSTVWCERGVHFRSDAGVLVNARRARDPEQKLTREGRHPKRVRSSIFLGPLSVSAFCSAIGPTRT